AAIAFEKAGILKPGTPAVIGPQEAEALAVIEARAAAIGAKLWCSGSDWDAAATESGLRLRDGVEELALPRPGLPGPHQIANAATAAVCARRLPGFAIGREALAAGLRGAVWPARMQRLDPGKLAA